MFQCLLQLQQLVLADAEVHPHRVARIQRREQRLLGGDQRAGLDQRAAHEAVARCTQRREFQVELHVAQQSLLRLHQRGTGALLRNRRVVVLLADRLLRDQPRVARQILLGVDEIRLGLGQARFGLRELGLEGPLVDDIEHVALLDACAVGKCLTLEQPGNLAADFDRVRRLRLRHVLVVDGHRDRPDLDHRYLGRRRRLRLRTAFAASSSQSNKRQAQTPNAQPARARRCLSWRSVPSKTPPDARSGLHERHYRPPRQRMYVQGPSHRVNGHGLGRKRWPTAAQRINPLSADRRVSPRVGGGWGSLSGDTPSHEP